jgi:hypothetical protein
MKTIILYTNDQGVELDSMNLEIANESLVIIRDFLISKSIDPNAINIKNATKKIFELPVAAFKKSETEKIKKIIDAFGETAITDGWELKVNEKTEAFRTELVNQCPDFEQTDYIKYFKFENGIEVDSKFDEQYFIDKNSTILSEPKQIEFYEKHCKAVELLNDLIQHPDNEFIALDKLLFFNSETKEFELNLKQYRDILTERVTEEERIRGEEYNRMMRSKYEENQRKIRENGAHFHPNRVYHSTNLTDNQ